MSHLPALAGTPGLGLTAVSTSRQDSARQLATEWGVSHHFTSAADLAYCSDVDLITISVKAPAHRRLIEQLIGAGKPVLCEWPLGVSATETRYLANLLAEHNIRAFVGLQGTAHPVLQETGRLVREGQIGTLLAMTLTGTRASKDPVAESVAYTLHVENGAGMAQILGGHSLAARIVARRRRHRPTHHDQSDRERRSCRRHHCTQCRTAPSTAANGRLDCHHLHEPDDPGDQLRTGRSAAGRPQPCAALPGHTQRPARRHHYSTHTVTGAISVHDVIDSWLPSGPARCRP